jgi:hypothetical protein
VKQPPCVPPERRENPAISNLIVNRRFRIFSPIGGDTAKRRGGEIIIGIRKSKHACEAPEGLLKPTIKLLKAIPMK